LVGQSLAIRRAIRLIEEAALTSAPVIITGESGTGKERAARAIHDRSPRQNPPYVAINCAAVPESLIESELFGHERGAFTGADRRREGCFERADGGSLLLDEITEMRPEMQAKLLRSRREENSAPRRKQRPANRRARLGRIQSFGASSDPRRAIARGPLLPS
jgi:DNA-binding NtrC family response regulator